MINTSIKKRGLLHCIGIANSKMLFFGAELAPSVAGIKTDLAATSLQLVCQGGDSGFGAYVADGEIAAASTESPPASLIKDIGMRDTFGYIYTSGTTGLPKAAIIKHTKMVTLTLNLNPNLNPSSYAQLEP